MTQRAHLSFIFLYLFSCTCISTDKNKSKDGSAADRCFCKLNGDVDDCDCSVDYVHKFNNLKIFPRLQSLLNRDYFRYFKVSLSRQCPFWVDDSQCALRDCHVKDCGRDDLPSGLLEEDQLDRRRHEKLKYVLPLTKDKAGTCTDENNGGLGSLDTTISDEHQETIKNWTIHDDQQDTFCELDDDRSDQMLYVDLLKNPERYTGYEGPSAHRIWNSVYKENCFNVEGSHMFSLDFSSAATSSQCLEKRAFYRLISGLHTSINVHLSRHYLLKDERHTLGVGELQWGPNSTEFQRRFDPVHEPEGPQRLKNLYFTYLVELRAIAKAAPYLHEEMFYTGDPASDRETRTAMEELLSVLRNFENPFDESRLFRGDPQVADQLKAAFRNRFRNISRIMDCVGCDKCKLWGKLQVQGMGTALKILFSGETIGPDSIVDPSHKGLFQLRRTEIVSLLNAFGRLSTSIHSLDQFRELLKSS